LHPYVSETIKKRREETVEEAGPLSASTSNGSIT
jgi:hypothetical protein